MNENNENYSVGNDNSGNEEYYNEVKGNSSSTLKDNASDSYQNNSSTVNENNGVNYNNMSNNFNNGNNNMNSGQNFNNQVGVQNNQNEGYNGGNYGNNGNYYNNAYIDPMLNHPEIKKFNWSAFVDAIFWGIGNKCYMALLSIIPFFGFFWSIYCGFKGNEWAWTNGNYSSIEEFKAVQDTWNRAGLARFIYNVTVRMFMFFFIYFIIFAVFGMIEGLRSFNPY